MIIEIVQLVHQRSALICTVVGKNFARPQEQKLTDLDIFNFLADGQSIRSSAAKTVLSL